MAWTKRMGADGEAITEPAPDAVAAAVERVRASGADACAVCLLFAFRLDGPAIIE